MDSASTADWIAAIGQAVGAVGTLAAVVVALAVSRRDGQRVRSEKEQQERSQARMVVGHLEGGHESLRPTVVSRSTGVVDCGLASGRELGADRPGS